MNNGRMSMMYDGQVADDLNKEQLIKAILAEYNVICDDKTKRALEEAFRCGFLRGEEYANNTSKNRR